MRDCLELAAKLEIPTIQMGWAFQGARLDSAADVAEKHVIEEFKRIVEFMRGDQRIVIEPAKAVIPAASRPASVTVTDFA